MENQHRKIAGYRDLSQAEIDLMNGVKVLGAEIGRSIEAMRDHEGLDQRWIDIGEMQLQQGIMALVRAIAQPTTF